MAFKGGTSLSKVYGVIDRFSEDIDVTLDYRTLVAVPDPFDAQLSKTQLRKLGEKLKAALRTHSHERIVPFLREAMLRSTGAEGTVEVSDDGEKVRLHYPSALMERDAYITESVLLELGGRNITEPNEEKEVRPYLADCGFELVDFESAAVDVLSPARTFWEKATLAHAECNRNEVRANAHRLSRHWYDLAQLADHEIGRSALANRALLEDVVKHKQVFFSSSFARYDACLEGALRLLPDGDALGALRRDYEDMRAAGMFSGNAPQFDSIAERLARLEQEINSAVELVG